jgi:6-phosphofructokinase 1
VLGHVQRGGTPSAFDRLLGTRFGAAAVDLAAEGGFGRVVVLRGQSITSAPIAECAGKEKKIDPEGELAKAARATGVELGAPAPERSEG